MMLLVPVHAASLLAINGHPGGWATGIYWIVHVFRMPLFFAMSGFFLALLLSRRGLGRTARNRTLRIAIPLALGMVTLVPLTILVARHVGTALAPDPGASQPGMFGFEPNFLWFLWYLLIIDGVAIVTYLLAPNLLQTAGQRFSSLICRPVGGILLLAVPTTLALWPEATWTVAPPGDTFAPELSALLYYGLFFGLGATLHTHRELVDSASRNAWRWTVCALAAAIPAAVLFSLHNSGSYGSRPEVHLAALMIYAIATWTTLIAFVGLADRYINRPRPAVRYLADSSYWIYLSHLPAMVLVIGLLGATTLGTGPQFFLATVGALAFSLATYPLLVRYTVIGRVLNGSRTRPQRRRRLRSRTALRGAVS